MSGAANFPTGLDDNTSLHDVVDGVTPEIAAHHNNTKEAVKAIEAKIGIFNTNAATSLDYRLGHPTLSHSHNGASGQGAAISASAIDWSAHPRRHIVPIFKPATAIVGSNVAAPVVLGRTMQLESISGALRRGPSGATTAFDVLVGPTSIYQASQGFRPIFPPGASVYLSAATPNLITYPSGGVITLDVDTVGSSEPGQDLRLDLVFRE